MIIPIQEVENITLSFTYPHQHEKIFSDYTNDNFSQKLTYENRMVTARIKSVNFLRMDLQYRIFPRETIVSKLPGPLRETVNGFFDDSQSLKNYLYTISVYISENIQYSDEKLPQDALSVAVNKQANCVGFSNLVKLFLDAAGIGNQWVRGFFLKESPGKTLIPVPHRWIEIILPNDIKFFFDPQNHKFSSYYITLPYNVDFKRIRKFEVNVIDKSKEINN